MAEVERPRIPMRKSQFLVIRVHDDTTSDPFRWDWHGLDYSSVSDSSPDVWVYGVFEVEDGSMPDKENPTIHWHRPHVKF